VILIYVFGFNVYSKTILFGIVFVATVIELILGALLFSIERSPFLPDWIRSPATNGTNGKKHDNGYKNANNGKVTTDLTDSIPSIPQLNGKDTVALKRAIIEECGEASASWIENHVDLAAATTLILSTTTRFNLDNQPDDFYRSLVNLKRINDIKRINKFFESANAKLPTGGIFVGCGETYGLRKERILSSYPPMINYMIYTVDFVLRRVFPKLRLTRKIYFLITRGKNRILSRTETLGRLYSCGFEVIREQPIGDLLYWCARKIKEPAFDEDPTYGIMIRLKRVGKNGREFNVYKLRTMHAYSEYMQHYVYQNNNLDEGGKFKDDFRVTTLGRFFRKFWLDELPMLINLLKGDMKVVGIRPLSSHYFNLYSPELREKRIKTRPGLIPPYYAQFPPPVDLEEIQQNESKYLDEYFKHPIRTDIKYFFAAAYNILIKKARSK